MRQQVATGKWRPVGTARIDGLSTVELEETDGEGRDLYVLPSSYLIVEEVTGGSTIDFEYLPPDQADVALL